MHADEPTGKPDIECRILAYLAENPNAQDTLEGIAEWWLLKQQIQSETRNVAAAVKTLVRRGLLLRSQGRDSKIHYRLNPARQDEIRKLLRDL